MKIALLASAVAVFMPVGPVFAGSHIQAVDGDDRVVATVNGVEIRRSDIEVEFTRLPQQYRQYPANVLFDLLLNSLVESKVVALAARKSGLLEDEGVRKQLARIEDQILEREFLNRRIKRLITKAKMEETYKKFVEENPSKDEVHARHILVDTEEQAVEITTRLAKGEDFAALAGKLSKGPSRRGGGDLGFFSRQQMVPAFSEAAFALEPGKVTEKPVRTQFGWHVIKVVEKRSRKAPTFAEAEEQLRASLAQELGQAVIKELKDEAAIIVYGADGRPPAAAPTITPAPAK